MKTLLGMVRNNDLLDEAYRVHIQEAFYKYIRKRYVVEETKYFRQIGPCVTIPPANSRHETDPSTWEGSKGNRYPMIPISSIGTFLLHRVSWFLEHGSLPDPTKTDKIFIRHLCHNRRCFNPYHLRPGTQAQNNRDQKRYPYNMNINREKAEAWLHFLRDEIKKYKQEQKRIRNSVHTIHRAHYHPNHTRMLHK